MRAPCLLAAAAVLAASASARADTVHGTRFETRDIANTVEVQLDRGVATLVVRRTVLNPGVRHDHATFWIDVPDGAVATRLRSMGARGDEHVWFEGELMEAEEAARKYRELTGIGGYYPKDPALLSWRSRSKLALQVFPISPSGFKTVEYTFKMPTDYHDGVYEISLPAMGTEQVTAQATLRASREGDELRLNGNAAAPSATVSLAAPVKLAIAPKGMPRVGGALASLKIARGRFLTRARVEAAPRLSEAPQGARVIALLDVSRSMEQQDVRAALSTARAWLSHFPNAQAEVIAYDREPHPLMGKFEPVASVITRLDGTRFERRNGSHLDRALELARTMLRTAPAGTPTRVLVLSDLRMRAAATPESFEPLAKATGALVHISTIHDGAPVLHRADSGPWHQAARATGGVAWHAWCDAAALGPDQREVFEELARPVRIDNFAIDAPDLAVGAISSPGSLREGQGVVELRIAPAHVRSLQVTGELWSRPIKLTLAADETETRTWAALAFGSPLESELTETEMMILARKGGAVSPVTSYLAIEPGVRPSTEGLNYGSGHGRLSGSHRTRPPQVRMGASMMRDRFDHEGWLRAELRSGLTRCGSPTAHATVALETTSLEIVEVSRVSVAAPHAAAETCLRNAAWALELPEEFRRVSSRSFNVKI